VSDAEDIHYTNPTALHASPWVLGTFDSTHAADGYTVEDGEQWAPDGQLVLQVRQPRRILGE
jgi:acyl-CoA thioesterase